MKNQNLRDQRFAPSKAMVLGHGNNGRGEGGLVAVGVEVGVMEG